MMKTMTGARFSLRLEPETKDWPEIDAKRQLIRDAVLEAQKGVFVSQEAVHTWMDSWDTENELPMPKPDVFLRPYI
jgi:hypothetical protein